MERCKFHNRIRKISIIVLFFLSFNILKNFSYAFVCDEHSYSKSSVACQSIFTLENQQKVKEILQTKLEAIQPFLEEKTFYNRFMSVLNFYGLKTLMGFREFVWRFCFKVSSSNIAIVCLTGGRGERMTPPQAVSSQGHVCPKPLCTMASGYSIFEILVRNGKNIAANIYASTNIPDEHFLSESQRNFTFQIRKEMSRKTVELGVGYKESKGLGSAFAAYGEEITRAIRLNKDIKYVIVIPGDTPYTTNHNLIQELLAYHFEQTQIYAQKGKKLGLTFASTEYLNERGQVSPTIEHGMGCIARNRYGEFIGMVEAEYLKPDYVESLNLFNPRFPIGLDRHGKMKYISPLPEEDPHEFVVRTVSSPEYCAGIMVFSREAYLSISVDSFVMKANGERDAFSGPIVGLIDNGFSIAAFNTKNRWCVEGANTRTQLRQLEVEASEKIKKALASRGVDVSELRHIVVSEDFDIKDVEAGSVLKGNLFFDGKIKINRGSTIENSTLVNYGQKVMEIGNNSNLINSYISSSNVRENIVVRDCEIFSTDIDENVESSRIVLGKFKFIQRDEEFFRHVSEVDKQVGEKVELREDYYLLLEQVYGVTLLPETRISVDRDIMNFFEGLRSFIIETCKGDTFEKKIEYFLRNPESIFAKKDKEGRLVYTTKDLPLILSQHRGECVNFRDWRFYIGSNVIFGGNVVLAGKNLNIGSDTNIVNSYICNVNILENQSLHNTFISPGHRFVYANGEFWSDVFFKEQRLPFVYWENGIKVGKIAKFIESLKLFGVQNIDGMLLLLDSWKRNFFADYNFCIDDPDLFREDYVPGIISFAEYCEKKQQRLYQILNSIVDIICLDKHSTEYEIMQQAARIFADFVDIHKITEQQVSSELWKMARIVYSDEKYDPYKDIANFITLAVSSEDIEGRIIRNLGRFNARGWALLLAAANGLEITTRERVPEEIDKLKHIIENPEPSEEVLAVDGSDLFNEQVFSKPQELIIFTDNRGEVLIDLCYVLAQARKYKELDPANVSDWHISIIPRGAPIHVDATKEYIQNFILNDPNFAELKDLVEAGKVLIFERGSLMQGLNLRTLAPEIIEHLRRVKEKNGTVISLGVGNGETIYGLKIRHFYFFKVKSGRIQILSGAPMGTYVAAYIPSKYKRRVSQWMGRETLAGITMFEGIKLYVSKVYSEMLTEDGFIKPENTWLFLLPLLSIFNRLGTRSKPFFIQRSTELLIAPWTRTVDVLKGLGFNLHSLYISKKISSLDKYSDLNYFASLINSFLTKEEMLERLSMHECVAIVEMYQKLDCETKKEVDDDLNKLGINMNAESLNLLSRGLLVKIFARIGIDVRYRLILFRSICKKKNWELDRNDFETLKKIDPYFGLELENVYMNKGQYTQTAFIKKVDSMLFEETVKITERMYRSTTHATRPMLNIILKNTSFARQIVKERILFIDDAVAMGRTAITSELLLKAFYAKAVWAFVSITSEEGYAQISEGFTSVDNSERLPENRPEWVPLIGTQVIYDVDTIPFLKTYSHQDLLEQIEREMRIANIPILNEEELKEKIQQNNNAIILFIKTNFPEYANSSEEIMKICLAAFKFFARKDMISEVFLKDYLAPKPWLVKEQHAFFSVVNNVTARLTEFARERGGLEILINMDKKVSMYEQRLILQKWLSENEEYKKRQIKGIERLKSDRVLVNMISKYIEQSILLNGMKKIWDSFSAQDREDSVIATEVNDGLFFSKYELALTEHKKTVHIDRNENMREEIKVFKSGVILWQLWEGDVLRDDFILGTFSRDFDIARYLINRYFSGIGEIESMSLLGEGNKSTPIKIKTEHGMYVLKLVGEKKEGDRVFNEKLLGNLRYIVYFNQHLGDKGLPVTKFIKKSEIIEFEDSADEYLIEYEGKYYLLMVYLDNGAFLVRDGREGWNSGHHFQLGAFAALIQNVTSDFSPRFVRTFPDRHELLPKNIIERIAQKYAELRSDQTGSFILLRNLYEKYSEMVISEYVIFMKRYQELRPILEEGFIHNDLHCKNVMFDTLTGKVTGVIDIDFSQRYPRVVEFMGFMLNVPHGLVISYSVSKFLCALVGYQATANKLLSDQEIKGAVEVIRGRFLEIAFNYLFQTREYDDVVKHPVVYGKVVSFLDAFVKFREDFSIYNIEIYIKIVDMLGKMYKKESEISLNFFKCGLMLSAA